ncbi:MAG: hypothetical protein ACE5GD_00870 [Candidatus Geothermarchaeales archaeon]
MRESTLWLIDLIAIAMLAITLAIHLFPYSSLVSGVGISEALRYENVLVRAKNPLYLVTYTIFLASILYHAMYRLKSMLLEFYQGGRFEKVITTLCIVIGLVVFIYGLYVNLVAYLG